jgi:ubiquitin C-terminal hydrolase
VTDSCEMLRNRSRPAVLPLVRPGGSVAAPQYVSASDDESGERQRDRGAAPKDARPSKPASASLAPAPRASLLVQAEEAAALPRPGDGPLAVPAAVNFARYGFVPSKKPSFPQSLLASPSTPPAERAAKSISSDSHIDPAGTAGNSTAGKSASAGLGVLERLFANQAEAPKHVVRTVYQGNTIASSKDAAADATADVAAPSAEKPSGLLFPRAFMLKAPVLSAFGASASNSVPDAPARSLALRGGNPRKVGFPNLGNSCYMNAVINALLLCRPFARALADPAIYKTIAATLHKDQKSPLRSTKDAFMTAFSKGQAAGKQKASVLMETGSLSSISEEFRKICYPTAPLPYKASEAVIDASLRAATWIGDIQGRRAGFFEGVAVELGAGQNASLSSILQRPSCDGSVSDELSAALRTSLLQLLPNVTRASKANPRVYAGMNIIASKKLRGEKVQEEELWLLKRGMAQYDPAFGGYGQQDAHEFLTGVLSTLQESLEPFAESFADMSGAWKDVMTPAEALDFVRTIPDESFAKLLWTRSKVSADEADAATQPSAQNMQSGSQVMPNEIESLRARLVLLLRKRQAIWSQFRTLPTTRTVFIEVDVCITCTNPKCRWERHKREQYHDLCLGFPEQEAVVQEGAGLVYAKDRTETTAASGTPITLSDSLPIKIDNGKSAHASASAEADDYGAAPLLGARARLTPEIVDVEADVTPAQETSTRREPSTLRPVFMLDDLLRSFFRNRKLSIRCERCVVGQEVDIAFQIVSLPRVLIFQLKRFEMDMAGRFQKRMDEVIFPEQLDMSAFCQAELRYPPPLNLFSPSYSDALLADSLRPQVVSATAPDSHAAIEANSTFDTTATTPSAAAVSAPAPNKAMDAVILLDSDDEELSKPPPRAAVNVFWSRGQNPPSMSALPTFPLDQDSEDADKDARWDEVVKDVPLPEEKPETLKKLQNQMSMFLSSNKDKGPGLRGGNRDARDKVTVVSADASVVDILSDDEVTSGATLSPAKGNGNEGDALAGKKRRRLLRASKRSPDSDDDDLVPVQSHKGASMNGEGTVDAVPMCAKADASVNEVLIEDDELSYEEANAAVLAESPVDSLSTFAGIAGDELLSSFCQLGSVVKVRSALDANDFREAGLSASAGIIDPSMLSMTVPSNAQKTNFVPRFCLDAIVRHEGSTISAGHYTTDARHDFSSTWTDCIQSQYTEDQQTNCLPASNVSGESADLPRSERWHRYDDSWVYEKSQEQVFGSDNHRQAYLLFYVLDEPHSL